MSCSGNELGECKGMTRARSVTRSATSSSRCWIVTTQALLQGGGQQPFAQRMQQHVGGAVQQQAELVGREAAARGVIRMQVGRVALDRIWMAPRPA